MKDLLKNKTVLSFVGGIAATIAGAKFLKSDKARTMAVNSLASGMKLKDDAMATYETIKEKISVTKQKLKMRENR